MTNLNERVKSFILSKRATGNIGFLLKGISNINPTELAKSLEEAIGDYLYLDFVGYGLSDDASVPGCEISNKIERAVGWRNIPECSGRIIVFVKNDSDKLHSLADFDQYSVSDISEYLLLEKADAAINTPEKNFWTALASTSQFYSLETLEEFINEVEKSTNPSTAIQTNLWLLNLLPDEKILSSTVDQEKRLEQNRNLILAIGQLSEESRKKLSRALARKDYASKPDLQRAYAALQRYYKYGDKKTLKEMTFALVEELFTASKQKAKPKPKPKPESDDDPQDDNSPLRTKDLAPIISDILIDGDQEDIEDLTKLLGELKNHYDPSSEKPDIAGIGGRFGDHQIIVDECKTDFRKLLGQICTNENWGALIKTEETVLKDAITADYESIELLQPLSAKSRVAFNRKLEGMISLFDFIKAFDTKFAEMGITPLEKMTPVVEELIEARKPIIDNLDLILNYPVLLFGGDTKARKDLVRYIDAWGTLYHALSLNDPLMRKVSSVSTAFVNRAVLSLDILYIQTPKEWKAVLLPVHPLYLWRYYEVFKDFDRSKTELTEDNKAVLKEVLTKLPQILSFVILNEVITDTHENKVLPCSGNYEMLPTFENKTNRYLGNDGIESFEEIITRWIGYAPYTKNEVRICIVDVPDLLNAIRDIKSSMNKLAIQRVVVDVYLTRGQNGNNDLSQLDYAGKDYEIAEFIKQERLAISIKNVTTPLEVKTELDKKPVHLAFYFDQSSYQISYGPTDKDLIINPLVITYDYNFDEMEQRGTIYPSCEMNAGLIGDFHKLMRSAEMTTTDQTPRPAYNRSQDISAVVSTIQDNETQWLIAADRDTNNYDPGASIPIGEVQYDKRMVNIWASTQSRVILDYKKLLRSYNLYPNDAALTRLLRDYGHIAGSGLISIPKYGADANAITNKKKGLLGTLFAASWYNKTYPGSLIASLDDDRARIWLSDSKYGNERADLVGLRYDQETNTLYVQPIEVKTRDEDPDAKWHKDDTNRKWVIEGHAADQIASVAALLTEVFAAEDQSDMFVNARREVLKFQIVTECFRNIHEVSWQSSWTAKLKELFKVGQKTIAVEIKGILVHVKLSDAGNGYALQCVNEKFPSCPIQLQVLTAQDIQNTIFEDPSKLNSLSPEPDIKKEDDEEAIIDRDIELTENKESAVEPEEPRLSEETEVPVPTSEQDPGIIVEDKPEPKLEESDPDTTPEAIQGIIRDFSRSCQDYHISLKEISKEYIIGPSVIRITFTLARGQSANAFSSHLEDISREMRRSGIIIQRKSVDSDELMLDVPRQRREKVLFKNVESKIPTTTSPEQLYFALGRTPNGTDIIKNLAELPHLLVGGSTGSGKSVFLFTILASLLKSHPKKEELTLVLSSSKIEDFIYFNGLPHLYNGSVISEASEATEVIRTVIAEESKKRSQILAEARTANIIEYNKKAAIKMAPIVIVIDEFADLADQFDKKQDRDDFYRQVQRIAQSGRNRGIHLIICTQRPEAKIVPPTTKAQLPARVALRVPDPISSRMIIDTPDAQYLQKHGDLLFREADDLERAQGYLIETSELEQIVAECIAANS